MIALLFLATVMAEPPRSELSRFDVTRSDFVALREYVDVRFDAQQKAVDKAEIDLNKRLDAVNEFRKQLGDQTQSFLTRNEYNQAHSSLVDKVNDLTKRVDAAEARSGGLSTGWAYLVGAIGVGALIYRTVRARP